MQIKSVNVSLVKTVDFNGKAVETGIFKMPLDGLVELTANGIIGDKQADLKHHGGIDKAVYTYPFEHYDYWQKYLNRDDFTMGQFGENLTTNGLLEKEVLIGNRYRFGTTILEVSQPRQPCFKLGIRMNDPGFPAIFNLSCKSGIYFRVIEPGHFKAGDVIELVEEANDSLSVHDINRIMFIDKNDQDLLKASKLVLLNSGWREIFKKRLDKQ